MPTSCTQFPKLDVAKKKYSKSHIFEVFVILKYVLQTKHWSSLDDICRESLSFQLCTQGCISFTTLLVKCYNDLLDRQSSGRGRDEVTYFSVIYTLALCMPIFKKKIPLNSLFPRRFRKYFFMKIGIRSPKVYTIHPCPPSRTSSIK